ncbi:glycosyltransferase family 4 protein [Leptothoe spongobia]|uniref:Glycosyltransferase family 4 protein n=1 Tax=Leptothoe spongobia TAU-MAC 1115 TaxID=1967444 RepID=A0A947DGM7_9CYAN|nr:glycosyltransferase family 4 protein [Leptothoe spongobia]MBT9316309.1 glycosyltransferase family 4 protein [Leptothoe spongobia TAU-MAC 1115]
MALNQQKKGNLIKLTIESTSSLLLQYLFVLIVIAGTFIAFQGTPGKLVLFFVISICSITVSFLEGRRFSLWHQENPKQFFNVSNFYLLLEAFSYLVSNHIVAPTDSCTRILVSKGVQLSKIKRIFNWANTNFIRPLSKYDNSFRQHHGLQDKFIVLYSGNIARTQGVRIIIHAANTLRDIPDIEFVIVGEERQLGDLDNLRRELGVENVTLLPFVRREELPTMLAAADVSLIIQKASVVGFNMPSKTMLLMASGRPIVASVPGDGAEAQAVQDSMGGIVVEPEKPNALARAILKLYNDPISLEQLGKNGRMYAISNYSFEQALEDYESLLSSLTVSPHITVAALQPKDTSIKSSQ